MGRLQSLREHVRLSLWFMPALFALGAILLGIILLAVDQRLSGSATLFFLYGGTAEGARSVLSTIAQSMLTFTGLVFTITMLVLQLASAQLSPRVMRTFLRDRSNQAVLGLFVATFVYTLVVLREVRSGVDGTAAFVPGLSIWVGFALLLGSVAAFVFYIDHMAHSIRATTVIGRIARETRQALDHLYPDRVGQSGASEPRVDVSEESSIVINAPKAGVLLSVDEGRLSEAASGQRRVQVLGAMGDFIAQGAPIARLSGPWDSGAADQIRDAVGIGDERSVEQDPAFGFRQLVDIALRALSPGTNDPTTAVQALDRLHDLLRHLVGRALPPRIHRDRSGQMKVALPGPAWEDYLELAVEEIRIAGCGQVQVARRLRRLLQDLLSIAPDERTPVLRHQLNLLESGVARCLPNEADHSPVPTSTSG